jgi:hypothetical protein
MKRREQQNPQERTIGKKRRNTEAFRKLMKRNKKSDEALSTRASTLGGNRLSATFEH